MNRAVFVGAMRGVVFAFVGVTIGVCELRLQQPMPTSTPVECFYRYPHADGNALPDPACTPGDTNTRVTQANIHETICTAGYSLRIRNEKPDSYFASLKVQQMRKYGASHPVSQYEEDHLISLELGGSNDASNLWPEPAASPNPKDKIENALKTLVCAGTMSLDEAQRRIRTDWTEALN